LGSKSGELFAMQAQLCAIGVQMLDGRHVIGLEVAAMDNERVVAEPASSQQWRAR